MTTRGSNSGIYSHSRIQDAGWPVRSTLSSLATNLELSSETMFVPIRRLKCWFLRIDRERYVLPLLIGAALCLFSRLTGTAWAADPDSGSADIQLEVGFHGTWKLGHDCPLRITLPAELAPKTWAIEIQTIDGDGVDVIYRKEITDRMSPSRQWISVRIGRLNSRLVVRLLDRENAQLREIDTVLSGGLDSDQPLVLALGSAMGVQERNRTTAGGADAIFSTALVDSADLLPLHWRDYGSCDLMLISTANQEFLRGISAEQWSAIDTWIRRGGGCIISLSGDPDLATTLAEAAMLRGLLPGIFAGVGQISDPGVLESLVATDEPLGRFSAALINQPKGKVELTFSDTLARDVPWWISYAHGHGTMRVIASDLDSPSFAQWKDRKLLWELLLAPYFDRAMLSGIDSGNQSGDSSYLGYDDLVGQLRASLDVFSAVREVSFGQIAAMLVGVLLLIGPIDYLVSVKWLQRPAFSWYFSGSLLIVISIGLTLWYAALRPDKIYVNSAQIIDLDTQNSLSSGRLWLHVYSGNAHKLNLSAKTDDPSVVVDLDWQGLPGSGLGGLRTQLNTDRGMPHYVIQEEPMRGMALRSVGVPAAGTKCLTGAWEAKLNLKYESSLTEIPGVDQLTGELVNPLDVDLFEPMLFYHNWYYSLNSQLAPGEKVSISFDTIPKDLTRRLNGRRNVDGNDTITKWDPADRNSIDRLLEMMMFYKAAAGRTYTSLRHRYQPNVDLSNLLETDRALLVGRLEESPVLLSVACADQPDLELIPDMNRVWCRISIPVAKASAEGKP